MALIKFLPATALVMSLILFGNVAQRVVNQPDGKLHVVFLDQGQSNAVLIHTPDNGVMLINGGQFPVRLLTELGDRLPSNHRTIDILMITSDDRSDIAAVPDLTERYDVQVAIIADGLIGTDIGNAINALEQDDTTIIRPQPNQRITTDDGVQFDLILVEDVDEMLIRLIYKDAIFLFNNDLSSGETDILMQYQAMMQSTVLQASQHATANSNDEEWLDVVSPQIIIVQNDASSRQSQTSQGVIEQLQNIGDVYQTTEVGSVELVTDGELIEIYVSNDD